MLARLPIPPPGQVLRASELAFRALVSTGFESHECAQFLIQHRTPCMALYLRRWSLHVIANYRQSF